LLLACNFSDLILKTTKINKKEDINKISSTTTRTSQYNIVDTNQENCFDVSGKEISCKDTGQDAQYTTLKATYSNNNDGTITDHITKLVWQQSADTNGDNKINYKDKMRLNDALSYCQNLKLAEKTDWRLPDIKSMYSLIDFNGKDVSGYDNNDMSKLVPFINNYVFGYEYGDTSKKERIIDAQWATATKYVSNTMNGYNTMFGVNFADGRIRAYPLTMGSKDKKFYVQCVRGNEDYGKNNFLDNNDGTINDIATNLMWQKNDNGVGVKWNDALQYCENSTISGYTDWKLPDAKELQSIVDYSRSPQTSNSASINSIFNATSIINENQEKDYGSYWSSTSHKNMMNAANAVYVSFGRTVGYVHGFWLDVHGAGAQRSGPKDISLVDTKKYGFKVVNGAIIHGPQGGILRGLNFVRCVRSII
jgi:hypothetical protein